MMPYLTEEFGNPSSQYKLAWKAKDAITNAREQIQNLLNCKKYQVIFTSGGTEADNIVLRSIAYRSNKTRNRIIVSAFEHPAILQTCKHLSSIGVQTTYLPVSHDGFVLPETLERAISNDVALVSIMMANNEIGTIQPVGELAEIAHRHGALFHTDAVQAVGHVHIGTKALGIDMLSLSGHKFGGPKGIGALITNATIEPLIYGGGQESGMRSGTENVAGIVGMTSALQESVSNIDNDSRHIEFLRNQLIDKLLSIHGTKLNGGLNNRLPGNINISFDGIEGESIVLYLAQRDICVSAGSACHSGSLEGSHVLSAIGAPHKGAIRITLGAENELYEIEQIFNEISSAIKLLRI